VDKLFLEENKEIYTDISQQVIKRVVIEGSRENKYLGNNEESKERIIELSLSELII
jgi:hypothetical protein